MARGSALTFKVLGKDVNASKVLKNVGQQAGKTGGKLSGAFSMLGGPAGIATAAAAGITAVGFALFDAGKAAAEDQAEQKKLAKTMKNVTGATDDQVEATEDFIDATQRATGVADSELRPALGNLLRATEDTQVAQDLLNTALDVAAGTGKPVETIATALSKAYTGNTTALSRLGIQLKDANGKALPFKDALKKLNAQFGGQAQDQADTYEGKMKRVGIAFDELKESIGAKVLPILDTFASWLADEGLPKLEAMWEFIDKKLIPVVAEYLAPVIDSARSAFADMGKTVDDNRQFFDDLLTVAKPLASFAGGQMAGSLRILAWLFEKVTDAAVFARDVYLKVRDAMGKVVQRAQPLVKALTGAASTIKSAFAGAFNSIASAWNRTIGSLSFSIPGWVPGIGGNGWSVPDIPMLADGGIVTRPTLALIGEAGPEAVVPLSRGGYGGGVTVNVYADNVVGRNAARELVAMIEDGIKAGQVRTNVLATR